MLGSIKRREGSNLPRCKPPLVQLLVELTKYKASQQNLKDIHLEYKNKTSNYQHLKFTNTIYY